MPLYVIDNGESYSDHAVLFVECELTLDVMKKVVACRDPQGEVLAFGDTLNWLGHRGGASLVDYFRLVEAEWDRRAKALTGIHVVKYRTYLDGHTEEHDLPLDVLKAIAAEYDRTSAWESLHFGALQTPTSASDARKLVMDRIAELEAAEAKL